MQNEKIEVEHGSVFTDTTPALQSHCGTFMIMQTALSSVIKQLIVLHTDYFLIMQLI